MINKIKNIFYLNTAYFVKLIMPLLMIPVIKNKYSNEDLSIYLYAIAAAGWLVLIIEFGFSYYGGKKLSIVASSESKLQIEAEIFVAKLILAGIIAVPAIILLNSTEVIGQRKEWGLISILYALGLALYPNYRVMSKNESSKLLISEIIFVTIMGIILLLDDEGRNFTIVGLSMCLTRLLTAFVESRHAFIYAIKTKNVFKSCAKLIFECKNTFIFNMALALYTTVPIVLCAFLVKDLDKLNIILVADRVVKSVMGALGQIGGYFYTQLVKEDERNFEKNWRIYMVFLQLFAICSFLLLYFRAEEVLSFIKIDNQHAIYQVKMMSLIPIIGMANYMLAINYLVVRGMQKIANVALLSVGVIAAIIVSPTIYVFDTNGPAITWVAAEIILLIILISIKYIIKNKGYKIKSDVQI